MGKQFQSSPQLAEPQWLQASEMWLVANRLVNVNGRLLMQPPIFRF